MSTCAGAVQLGYLCERHDEVTEDGFILGIFRLSNPQLINCSSSSSPVLLLHGLFGCYSLWLLRGPSIALGYMMADEGYDVWMMNARGNEYSRTHLTLSSDQAAFWDWTWHEMGYYDLPATIDHVLRVTGQERVLLVGHSQGNTAVFVMCASRPEYNNKVEYTVALGPTVFLEPISSPIFSSPAAFPFLKMLTDNIYGRGQLLTNARSKDVVSSLERCSNGSCTLLARTVIENVAGADPDQWNEDLMRVTLKYYLSGTSSNTILHYSQVQQSGQFPQFDWGVFKNLVVYGSTSPPSYDLSRVSAPVLLFLGDNDQIVTPQVVSKLLQHLECDVDVYHSPHPLFNHCDYVWAQDVKELVNDVVLSFLASKTNRSSVETCLSAL